MLCGTSYWSKRIYMQSRRESLESAPCQVPVKVNNKWQKKAVNQPSVIYPYNQNMGGVDLSDKRVTTFSRLMKSSVCLISKYLFISWNLACQMSKLSWASHLEMMLLPCLSSGRKELVNGKTFRLTERNSEPAAPIPQFYFNQEHLHYPIPHDNRLVCKVHVQRVDTQCP